MNIRMLLLFTSISLASFVTPGMAQTSFGADRFNAAQNKNQWIDNVGRQLSDRIRKSDSTLAINGPRAGMTTSLAITIQRDGSIVDIRIVESSGRPALDAATVRAASGLKTVQPFTPDMPGDSVTLLMGLETVRG